MPSSPQPPSLVTNRYSVTFDDVLLGEFTELTGMSVEITTAEQRVAIGDGKIERLRYPVNVSYGDLTLKAGRGDSTALYDWIRAVVDHDFQSSIRNGQLVEYGSEPDDRVAVWDIIGAWPTKWELGQAKAGESTIRIESLTLKVGRISRSKE